MNKIAVVLVPILLAACASAPKTDSSQASPSTKTASSSPVETKADATVSSAAETHASVPVAKMEASNLTTEMQELHNQSVFFDFDRYDIKTEYRDVIVKHAEFIKAHENDLVTVEGNCDERGSNEYNLA